jgi:hypothetical protein
MFISNNYRFIGWSWEVTEDEEKAAAQEMISYTFFN